MMEMMKDSTMMSMMMEHIAGMRLSAFFAARGLVCDLNTMDDIFRQTREAACHIIERKGATTYAVAAGLLRTVETILRNQSTVLSVSSFIEDYYGLSDVCLSLPTVVDLGGIEQILRLELSPEEIKAVWESAEVLKRTIEQLRLEET